MFFLFHHIKTLTWTFANDHTANAYTGGSIINLPVYLHRPVKTSQYGQKQINYQFYSELILLWSFNICYMQTRLSLLHAHKHIYWFPHHHMQNNMKTTINSDSPSPPHGLALDELCSIPWTSKETDWIANSEDPQQRSSLFWVCTVCSDQSVSIFRKTKKTQIWLTNSSSWFGIKWTMARRICSIPSLMFLSCRLFLITCISGEFMSKISGSISTPQEAIVSDIFRKAQKVLFQKYKKHNYCL